MARITRPVNSSCADVRRPDMRRLVLLVIFAGLGPGVPRAAAPPAPPSPPDKTPPGSVAPPAPTFAAGNTDARRSEDAGVAEAIDSCGAAAGGRCRDPRRDSAQPLRAD